MPTINDPIAPKINDPIAPKINDGSPVKPSPETSDTNPTPNSSSTAPIIPKSSYSSSGVRKAISDAGAKPADAAGSADTLSQFQSSVLPKIAQPTAPDYVSIYAQQRASNGVPALEDSANDLNQQIATLQQQQLALKQDKNIAYTEADYESRTKTTNDAIQNKIDSLNLQMGVVQAKLTTANTIVSTIMDLTEKTYTDANAQYNTDLTKNLQTLNAFNQTQYKDMTFDEKVSNDSRATLTTMFNLTAKNGQTFADWEGSQTPANLAIVSKLEAQAGLPQGFFQNFATVKPGANIKAVKPVTAADGSTSYQVLSDNSDGSMSVTTFAATTTPGSQNVDLGNDNTELDNIENADDENTFEQEQDANASQ